MESKKNCESNLFHPNDVEMLLQAEIIFKPDEFPRLQKCNLEYFTTPSCGGSSLSRCDKSPKFLPPQRVHIKKSPDRLRSPHSVVDISVFLGIRSSIWSKILARASHENE